MRGRFEGLRAKGPHDEPILADLRFARDVEAVWQLGPPPIAQLLAKLGRVHMIRTAIDSTVARDARKLRSELLAASGGDRMPVPPIWALAGGRR